MKLTKKAAVKFSDHTPVTYLLSTSLASCNLKSGFRRFVPLALPLGSVSLTSDCCFLRHEITSDFYDIVSYNANASTTNT